MRGGGEGVMRLSFFFQSSSQNPPCCRGRRHLKGPPFQVVVSARFFLGRTSLGEASRVMVAALTKESRFTLIVAGASEGGRCFVSGLASLADDLCNDEARGEGRSFISLHFLLKLRNALSRSPLLFRLSLSHAINCENTLIFYLSQTRS